MITVVKLEYTTTLSKTTLMTLNWRAAPFIRLLLPLAMGIGLSFSTSYTFPHWWLLIPFLILLGLQSRKTLPHQQWWFGTSLSLFLCLFGWSLGSQQLQGFRSPALMEATEDVQFFQGRIIALSERESSTRIGLQLMQSMLPDQPSAPLQGRLLVYLPSSEQVFRIGDQLQIKGRIQPIPPPKNPKAFDFATYMRSQGYYYQAFVKEKQWQYIPVAKSAYLRRQATDLRQQCLQILKAHLPSADEYAIGAALITGERSSLSPEIKAGYASTGAMHVLAVSGLHVGLVYVGLQFLLGLLGYWYGRWKWLKMALLLLGIWGFAYFTGATASVIRAACMFSFVLIGQSLKRYTNIYNTIAASAFCMLVINPILLFNIGFQLSYLALTGIVFFQGIIYQSWYIANPIGNYCWKLSSVALAAQLTTLPISLYYFHQFPVYFLLSGLVVVPAAMIILSVGLGLFVFNGVPILGMVLGKILYACIWGMNAVIFFLQQLPASTLSDIWIDIPMMLTLFMAVLLLGAYYLFYHKRLWYGLASCLLLFSIQYNLQAWQQFNKKEIVVYQVKGQTVIDCIDGPNCLRIVGGEGKPGTVDWATTNYQSYSAIKNITQIDMTDSIEGRAWSYQGGFLQFYDWRMAILDTLPPTKISSPIEFDFALLHDNPRLELSELKDYFIIQQLVWDGSNDYWSAKNWRAYCEEVGVKFADVREEGALVIGR